MKKSVKIALIVSAVLIITGAAAVITAFILGDLRGGARDFGLSALDFDTKTENISGNFESIMITDADADVELIRTADGTTRVEYADIEDRNYIITVDDGILDIRLDDQREWFDNIGVFYLRSPELKVYLPAEEYDRLLVDCSSGSVTVPDSFSFADLEISSSSGSIDCASAVSGKASITATSGSVKLTGMEPASLTVSSSSGSMTIRNVHASDASFENSSGSIVLSDCQISKAGTTNSSGSQTFSDCTFGTVDSYNSSGSIRFENCAADTLHASNSSGGITVDHTIAEDFMDLNSTSGGVRFIEADAGEIRVECSSGGVTGSLLTGKLFDVRTSSGSEDVPASDPSGGLCVIKTSSGSVRITVTE